MLLEASDLSLFTSKTAIVPMQLEDKKYRIYVYNPDNVYIRAEIHSKRNVENVESVSKYPLMPAPLIKLLKHKGIGDGAMAYLSTVVDESAKATGFVAKVPPIAMSIFDVTVE